MKTNEHAIPTSFTRRQSLSATITRACRRCGAPGTWVNHEHIRENWAGCYVEADDLRRGQYVGTVCPNCHLPRTEEPRDLGVIWSRVWKPVSAVRTALRSLIRRLMR
jgi:hypothetical protein